MLEAKCTKSTYTHNDEQHPFLDVNVGDVVLFEKLNGIFWFKGYSKRDDKNVHLTARGLAPEFFYEMFTIMDERSQGTCIKSEKQQEQPVEWKDEYREEDLRTRFAFYTYKNEEDDSVLYLSNVFVEESSRNAGFGTKILKAAERVAETIGAITIRLKVKQDSPANAWYRKRDYGYIASEGDYDWLEKNLEYLKPKRNEQPVIKKSNALFDKCVENCDPAIMKEVSDNVDKILASEGLEEEIERFLESEESTTYVPSGKFTTSYKDPKKIARHFAEWGAENLKR